MNCVNTSIFDRRCPKTTVNTVGFVSKDRKHGTYRGVWPVRRQKHRYLWCCSVSLLKWAKHRKMMPCGALRASPPSSTTVTTTSIWAWILLFHFFLRCCCGDGFYTDICFYKQTTLRTEAFSQNTLYAQILLHREFLCTEKFLRTDAFTHTEAFTQKMHRNCCTPMLCTKMYTDAFTHRGLYTQSFAQKNLA